MKCNKLLVSVIVLSFPLLSQAYTFSCDAGDDKKTSQLASDVNAIVGTDDADSCAIKDQLSKVATWRDGIPGKIQKFVSSNTGAKVYPDLFDQIVANSVNIPVALRDAEKAAQAEFEAADAEYNRLEKDKKTPQRLKDQAGTKFNRALEKWKAATNAKKAAGAPILKRVNDVLVNKMSSEAFKLKLKNLAANKHCIKNAEFNMSPINGFYDSEKSEKELQTQIAGMENDTSGDSLTVCSGIEKNKSETVAVNVTEDFSIGDEDFFANNEHELSPDKVKRILGKISKSLKSDKPECEKKIKSVQISTSSNQLANSPEIGKWDFAKLSKNRADFLAEVMKENFKIDAKDILTDPSGMNGDGTSGPCPYSAVKGKDGTYSISLKDITKMKKALNDARYGSISVEIAEEGKGCLKTEQENIRPEHEYFASKCYSVGMECAK